MKDKCKVTIYISTGDKMTEINTLKIYLNVFSFTAHVCIRQLWNIKREENDNYRVNLFKHTRGD